MVYPRAASCRAADALCPDAHVRTRPTWISKDVALDHAESFFWPFLVQRSSVAHLFSFTLLSDTTRLVRSTQSQAVRVLPSPLYEPSVEKGCALMLHRFNSLSETSSVSESFETFPSY